jgi:peptidoglycan/LPS O-acetylase OafA/YrhL
MDGSSRPALGTLRAFAVSWVVLARLGSVGSHWHLRSLPRVVQRIAHAGTLGADLLLLLSGLVMGGIVLRELEDTRAIDLLRSWVLRWLRTALAYAVTLALVAYASDDVAASRLRGSWSLGVGELFYLVLPVAVLAVRGASPRLTPRAGMRAVALLAVLASVVSRELVAGRADVFADGSTLRWTIEGSTRGGLEGLAVGFVLATLPAMNLTRAQTVAILAASAALIAAAVASPQQHLHESLMLAVGYGLVALAMTHDVTAPGLTTKSQFRGR